LHGLSQRLSKSSSESSYSVFIIMKRKIIYTLCLLAIGFTYCSQKNIRYTSIDFSKYVWNIHADTLGRLEGEITLEHYGNEFGNALMYMVHKNGGNWWYQEAKKNFPDCYANYLIRDREIKDTSLLKDYDKWVFFVDKKYLEGESSYGDYSPVDENGHPYIPSKEEVKKNKEKLDYYEKVNSTIEVILYEQKAGSRQWAEIDRKKFKTNDIGNIIHQIDPKTGKKENWKWDFLDQKLKESNESAAVMARSCWSEIKTWCEHL